MQGLIHVSGNGEDDRSDKERQLLDSGWRPISVTAGGGVDGVKGLVQPVTGIQTQPCNMCRSWEKNDRRIRQLVESKKNIALLPDGTMKHKIDLDVPDRQTQTFNINDFGWCRFHAQLAQQLHSCENWTPTRTVSDLMRKLPSQR